MKKWIIIQLTLLFFACESKKEIHYGCTDVNAINFDELAEEDDNSCEYLLNCIDAIDNDNDGLIDHEDSDCEDGGTGEIPMDFDTVTDPDFILNMLVSASDVTYTLTIGFSPTATDGYDHELDQYAPPTPPPPSFDAALFWNGERFYTNIIHGNKNDLVEHEWDIQLAYPIDNLIIISWDSESIIGKGQFYLQDAFGGVITNVDMTLNNSLELTNPVVTTLKIKITPFG